MHLGWVEASVVACRVLGVYLRVYVVLCILRDIEDDIVKAGYSSLLVWRYYE